MFEFVPLVASVEIVTLSLAILGALSSVLAALSTWLTSKLNRKRQIKITITDEDGNTKSIDFSDMESDHH